MPRLQELPARKDPAAVKLGRKGGKAGTGAAKARDSETMRRAALKRWAMARANAAAGKPLA